MGDELRLGARGVTRRFGPIVANDEIDLDVRRGTIHAVVGENGAGKTTLMRILYGLDQPDAGTVVVDGEHVALSGPRDVLDRGIGMVHQELAVVPDLTLLENLVLGVEPRRGALIDWATARDDAAELERRAGVELEWDVQASQAPIGNLQRLEIMRLLYRGVDTLILDEPTAVLAPSQVDELFRLLRALREQGNTVVFISHKLGEVMRIADEVTVLRGGRRVATHPVNEVSVESLSSLMVGESVQPVQYRGSDAVGDVVLEVHGLRTTDDRGIERLRGVDLRARAGEIVGIAGVAGNGQDELVECLVGLRRATSGRILLRDEDLTDDDVPTRRRAGLAYISSDRAHEGLATDASLHDNVLAGYHRRDDIASHGWLRGGVVRRLLHRVLDRYQVRHSSTSDHVRNLSGGNQQRLVIGRELEHDPGLLVAAHPTRGVDVKGIAFVHEQLLRLRDGGAAVVLVSEELDELLDVADRVVALYRGRVNGEVPGDSERRTELGRLMTEETADAPIEQTAGGSTDDTAHASTDDTAHASSGETAGGSDEPQPKAAS